MTLSLWDITPLQSFSQYNISQLHTHPLYDRHYALRPTKTAALSFSLTSVALVALNVVSPSRLNVLGSVDLQGQPGEGNSGAEHPPDADGRPVHSGQPSVLVYQWPHLYEGGDPGLSFTRWRVCRDKLCVIGVWFSLSFSQFTLLYHPFFVWNERSLWGINLIVQYWEYIVVKGSDQRQILHTSQQICFFFFSNLNEINPS